jgi:hypothetical protein
VRKVSQSRSHIKMRGSTWTEDKASCLRTSRDPLLVIAQIGPIVTSLMSRLRYSESKFSHSNVNSKIVRKAIIW